MDTGRIRHLPVCLLSQGRAGIYQRVDRRQPRRALYQAGTVDIVAALIAEYTMGGAGTVYAGQYVGAPLFCSTPHTPLFYDTATPPWVAFPLRQFQTGAVQCWDLVHVRPANGPSFMAYVLDAGPFGAHCVMDGDHCDPIVVDAPQHLATWKGTSAHVEVINLSAVARRLRD